MSGLYGPDGGIAVDGAYVYHAFGGYADGASAGFGLRKYNTGQYLEWTKFFNHKDDRAYYVAKVVRDAAGNFYLVGSQRPAGNNAAAAGYEYSAADKDLWIAKLNAAGDLVWSYSADASGLNRMDELYGAAVEGSALYVVGVASSASAGMDILARKYDISPSTYPALLWTYSKNGSGGGDDFGYGIAVGTGAVYLTGTVDNGAANKDIIVQGLNKTSALAGAPIVFNSAGNGNDTGYGLAVTTTGFVYVAGSTASVGAAGNAALFKFTLGGALVWDRYYNGKDNLDDAAYALELTTSGVIAAGYETSSGQGRVSSYRKFTLAGDLEWSRGLNLSAGDDYASALTVDASGRVYSAVSLDGRPGFYYFPEPDFNVLAAPYGVPGSVRLEWLSQYDVPAGSVFSVQYSTYSGGWNSSGAQVRYAADADIREGMSVARVVYGLESVPQYFKVWVSTSAGTFTPVGVRVALARPVEGSVFAAMSMYPNEAKLFVTGGGQRYNYGEKEFPGAARDASGNLYMVADTDWNGSGGLVIKKFNSAFSPLWTKYYAPGESFAVRANRMAADADGYLYLTGYERGPAAADGKDLFVMKFGANGLVWKTVYDFAHGDDTGYGVALDASGNVYAAGSVYTGSAQGDNIFLVKLSTAGVILSSANFDGSGSGPDAAYGIAVRGTDLYLAGSAYQSVNGRQLWTGHFRTSDLGQLGTAITGGAAAGAGYDVAVDSSGYVYAAGELHSADTANDAIVIKSSADLSAADWAFPVLYNSPGNANDAAYGIELDTTGSVYVTGSQERYDINQDKNLWIRKYSRSGSELWSQEFYTSAIAGDANSTIANSDEGFDLAVGTMGFVSVSGKFNGYYGLYRYKQSSALTINPVLTVKVSSAAASAPFPGVGVSLVPYSQTGGIDASGIRRGVTDSAGIFAAQVPAGKQYFIALDKQGFAPGIVAQQMDPYGSYFVQLNADATKQYILSPRPAASPYYPLTVTVTSATAGDYVMAEVFFAQTGERAAYGIAQVAVGAGSVTFTVSNVPPAVPGAYTLGVTIPNRSLARGVPMNAAFPAVSLYVVNMSTITGSSAGGFEVGASTTLPSVEGVVRNARTLAPLEAARVRVWNSTEPCASGNCDYNVYETLTDVNGKYSFYNVVSTAAAYSLSAQKAGYNRGLYGEISVSTSATVYREFQLQEATYTLRGVIRYRDVPVPNADVMVVGDYGWYAGSDSYRNGKGMTADGRARTAADGSFLFSPATLNGLPDGQLRMSVAFFGKWLDLNEGNYQDLTAIDADDARIVISSAGAAGLPNSGCTAGRNWKLAAAGGACQGYGDINFNIMPQKQNDYATLSGSVTFVTTYTVSAVNPLVISTMAPVTVMALQECSGVCADRSMGFAVLSGTYTVNVATYSIKLSTGMAYYTRVTASEWAEVSAFDDRADFKSTSTLSLTMNFVVTKAGSLKGVVKMPDGSSYKPAANLPEEQAHSLDILLRGQNVDVNEAWSVDDYGAFEFPNLAPGLYTVTMKPNGLGFRWAAPAVSNVAVVPGKVTQVTLKLADGLVVQPQVSGSSLPVISTPAWTYRMVPVESGVAMSQKKLTELLFGEDAFAFSYSTTTQTWDPKVMLTGKYDFYLTMGARYAPDADPASYDHFAAFITKVRGFSVQRSTSAAGLGTDAQPLPVSVSGAPGTELLAGTMLGERIYSDADLDRVFSNFSEIYSVSPAVMVYDAAGDLRGYSAGLPGGAQLADFEAALQTKDKALVRAYFAAHPGRFMVSGLAAGRYTAVFSNPNYPPVTKEITLPLDLSYNGSYPFNFDEQTVRTGDIYGTVKSTVTGSGLDNAVVYLKHRTVERFTTTAGDGSFRFSGLPSGIYRLEVTRDGFVKAGQKTSLAGSPTGDDSARLDFYLTPSQSNMAGKVYLSKFPAPLTAAGVTVVAYDETYNTLHPSEYLAKIEATTNDDGDYELAGVVPGHNYKVTAFYAGKLPATLDVAGDAVTEGVTYLPDMVMCEVAPQIKVKVIKSPAGAGQVDVTIISPKQLVSMPVCTVNEGAVYDAANAAAVALTPGPNNTYLGRFTESLTQLYYTVYVSAGDGANTMEKTVVYSSVDQGRAEQYIQKEAIQGGNIQMDPENGDYSGIELDAGALTSSGTASGTSGYRSSAYRASASDGLVGGFFSGLPAVRTIRTAKGDLNLAQAIQDLMASEVYNMELENASVNKPFTLTLTYDKNKAPENGNLRIYQYDSATGGWLEVPGDYTLDPVLGVLSVDVAALTGAHEGTGGIETPLGRKRLGMSAIVNGRYVPSAASTTQSGRFAVFTAMPPTGVAYAGPGFVVYNMPNPFDLKSKSVTLSSDIGASGIANPYATYGTLIKYHLPAGKSGNVKFVIYNVAGEKVRTITDGVRAGGEIYYSEWDGRNDNGAKCASGVYFMLTYLDGKQLGSKAHKMAIIK
ncbi:MAG: carboxypeptidase regulatory-like domain-containing protein [Elusimicrobia bacterium]|nr:carboxypeptidase regulatory-like domain-containing protein [Elusimicrobiota bacterium]